MIESNSKPEEDGLSESKLHQVKMPLSYQPIVDSCAQMEELRKYVGGTHVDKEDTCISSESELAEVRTSVVIEHTIVKKKSSKPRRVIGIIVRFVLLALSLYFFICSLNLLSNAFTLIGGRATGTAFQSTLLQNPICGLMIGVVATATLQSSSTSTSIVITMVASKLLTVPIAIPIIMGANIGTSVTGVIVALTQAADRDVFRRAFAAATVHDMFNWMTVFILLPLEVATGYLYRLTTVIAEHSSLSGGNKNQEFLSIITKPFTGLIVQIDKDVLGEIAAGFPEANNKSLLKYWCEVDVVNSTSDFVESGNSSLTPNRTVDIWPTQLIGVTECRYLFHGTSLSEHAVGVITLVMALGLMITCLILMVKVLKNLLQGQMAKVIQKTINANFPGRASFLTGYVALLIGAIVTVLVQSSSVVASALTPLVGLKLVTVQRVYPMMLGANIGTTSTAILASFAATGDMIQASFQIALCHLFFNLTGIIIWYPIPFMRKIPIATAKFLGRTTSKYRWFAFLYLLLMFFLAPLAVFGLSMLGWKVCVGVGSPFALFLLSILTINILQRHRKDWLPSAMHTWEFLPLGLRSLEPYDRVISKLTNRCTCCNKCRDAGQNEQMVGDQILKDPSQVKVKTDKPESDSTDVNRPSLVVDSMFSVEVENGTTNNSEHFNTNETFSNTSDLDVPIEDINCTEPLMPNRIKP